LKRSSQERMSELILEKPATKLVNIRYEKLLV